uniref:ROK family protein n=1 Tax=Ningiella ruwaisensis TaxID=2364274 RepID=UPI00109FCD92|nr:ROK family protein [Ningiella ruwaisensis]
MAFNSIAAIEAGGTKFICALFDNKHNLLCKTRIDTTTPANTLSQVLAFYNDLKQQGYTFDHLGLASFGPLDLNPSSPTFGNITKTPKPHWSDTPLASHLEEALEVTVHVDTDVNAAALAEAKWGAGKGCDVVVYITIGTGFGGGLVVNGQTVKGLVHPEMGHMRVKVPMGVKGHCPFHADCVEGLASGTSMQKIWGQSAQHLAPDHEAWDLQANIVGQFCHNLLMTLSPQRIILGGGVMQQSFLLKKIVEQTNKHVNGYLSLPENVSLHDIIVEPGLGTESGLKGALALVEHA